MGAGVTWPREGMTELLSEDGTDVEGVTRQLGWSGCRLPPQKWVVKGQANALPGYSASLRKYQEIFLKRNEKLLQVMPCRTNVEKTKLFHYFLLDAVDRCPAEINQAYDLYAGDIHTSKMKNKFS